MPEPRFCSLAGPGESGKESKAMKSGTSGAERQLDDCLVQSFSFKLEDIQTQRGYVIHQDLMAG